VSIYFTKIGKQNPDKEGGNSIIEKEEKMWRKNDVFPF
jgi:hypothetical protein